MIGGCEPEVTVTIVELAVVYSAFVITSDVARAVAVDTSAAADSVVSVRLPSWVVSLSSDVVRLVGYGVGIIVPGVKGSGEKIIEDKDVI